MIIEAQVPNTRRLRPHLGGRVEAGLMNKADWQGMPSYKSDRSIFREASGRFCVVGDVRAPGHFSISGIPRRRKGRDRGSHRLARRRVVDQRCSRKPRLANSITALSVLEVDCYDQDP